MIRASFLSSMLSRPRIPRGTALWWALVALFLAVIFLMSLVMFASSRSFLVQAETNGLSLAFGSDRNTWRLPEATVCQEASSPRFGADDLCGAAFSPVGNASEQLITWRDGSSVRLYASKNGGLVLEGITGMAPNVPEGATIHVPPYAWADAGPLTFHGMVVLGEVMGPGVRGYLREGRWEARAAGRITSILRDTTETVKSGALATGASVEVRKSNGPAWVSGHIVPTWGEADSAGGAALNVTMLSEFGDTVLSVRYFGLEGPVNIKPDWVDIATSSPLLLAIIGFLTVLVAASQILVDTAPRK